MYLGLEQETGYRSAELWELDLSRFSSVQEFADKFQKDGGRLDILVQNAAMIPSAYEVTEDSWESS
jgi:NAD(P)-dependent dehydrogenase (short-subunit alcohol dehydrogenase family)